jgi:hypothetical protein
LPREHADERQRVDLVAVLDLGLGDAFRGHDQVVLALPPRAPIGVFAGGDAGRFCGLDQQAPRLSYGITGRPAAITFMFSSPRRCKLRAATTQRENRARSLRIRTSVLIPAKGRFHAHPACPE